MIAIACDHGGFALKDTLIAYLEAHNLPYQDFGCFDTSSVDYPVYAQKAATAVASGACEKGILICGSGIGISIAANKIKKIRCAHVSDSYSARYSRMHNDANMLALGARVVGPGVAEEIFEAFLTTEFEGGRHQRRVDMLNALDEGQVLPE